jgi:hypothetical protein
MAIPATVPSFRLYPPALEAGFDVDGIAEGLAAAGVTDIVVFTTELGALFEWEACDEGDELVEEFDEDFEDKVLVGVTGACRTASFNGLESILSGIMVLIQSNET